MADRALVGNASSAKQTRKAAAFERRQREQFIADLGALLSTPTGVRFVCSLLERWSAWRGVFSTDALVMAHNAGQQDVAHELMIWISQAREDAIPNVMAEHARRHRERNNIANSSQSNDPNEQDDTSEEPDA